MGKHSEKPKKKKSKKIWIILAIIIIFIIAFFMFPRQIGYAIGWVLAKIISIFI